ncbi:MAG TPA: response regulator transcription factor [bacterium]|nr:response regulator transcription factor [bacterium]HMY37560.1 response regulator transcription factor [bacterium]HNB10876.1 response regulator transcription factor [bacterium]HNC50388.1 response regulator transcription factor [bacterium]HND78736.1 response regulator transcription factor [bacterium]
MRILIIDDSELIRERLKTLITEECRDVFIETEARAAQALESVSTIRPDVVILDIKMRDGSGVGVLTQIKNLSSPPIVIMFTQHPYPQFKSRCIFYGADYFLDKSTDMDQIPAIVVNLGKTQRLNGRISDSPGGFRHTQI